MQENGAGCRSIMNTDLFSFDLPGSRIHLVGAKGTGMTALAEILHHRGALLSGSDVPDVFYTDRILRSLGIELYDSFDPAHIPPDCKLIIHSAAYSRETNPELREAIRRSIPIASYPEALGALSRTCLSAGIAGVHGKTTTTALAGTILERLSIPTTVLAGSAVSNFNDRCTLVQGGKYFVAETCEYRKHFLNFSPRWIVLTSVESDHQDFFPTYESIRDAFVEYACSLPEHGTLIFCADDRGASEVADIVLQKRSDIEFIGYGFSAPGPWRITNLRTREGENSFSLTGTAQTFRLHLPGTHLILDAVAALILSYLLFRQEHARSFDSTEWSIASEAIAAFHGSKRRSERIAEEGGVLFLDDYGHHPTAIAATIEGIKRFWPRRRLVVDFMSHTYSRTIALQDAFVSALDQADAVALHRIYASAREKPLEGFSGRTLFDKLCARRPDLHPLDPLSSIQSPQLDAGFALYTEEPLDAVPVLETLLKPGDIFLTMGAGDNWKVGVALAERFKTQHQSL